jgi:membrane protein DedA with SNARE-associated domain
MLLAAAAAPLPATATLIVIGSSTATTMGPNFPLLSLVGTVAATSGDLFDYGLGRLSSRVLHTWLQRPLSWMLRATAMGRGNTPVRAGGAVVFLSRVLLPSLGSPISVLAGASKASVGRFLAWDVAGEAIYVVGNLAIGRWLGKALAVPQWHAWAFVGVVAIVSAAPAVLWRWWRWVHRRRERRGHTEPGQ